LQKIVKPIAQFQTAQVEGPVFNEWLIELKGSSASRVIKEGQASTILNDCLMGTVNQSKFAAPNFYSRNNGGKPKSEAMKKGLQINASPRHFQW
jgi:hypothetical protein